MKITLITVGKTDVKWVREGVGLYASRLAHYVSFQMVEIPQLKNASALSQEDIKVREGLLVTKLLKAGDHVILMDERGTERTSLETAAWLEKRLGGGKDLVFVIGGAYGFSEELYSRAQEKISLSRMTFSHQMVRAIFLEQLYRAFTILKGEPYHHE